MYNTFKQLTNSCKLYLKLKALASSGVYDHADCRWVYEKDGMFRAELEGEDGVVKGVYTVEDQQGNVETQAYISGGQQGGHRWAAKCFSLHFKLSAF